MTAMDQWACVSYASSNATDKVMETSTPPDLPPAIENKISDVSYGNATWHTHFCKQDTSSTSCKIFQTLYLCPKVMFEHTNIYAYIWIDFIHTVYIIKKANYVV